MKDKKIEDIFKSTFEKHSIQPSDKVWDSIRLQTASKKKTPIFAYAAAASIAIIIGMFFLLNTKEGMNSNINKNTFGSYRKRTCIPRKSSFFPIGKCCSTQRNYFK
jgi:hypothetical protein